MLNARPWLSAGGPRPATTSALRCAPGRRTVGASRLGVGADHRSRTGGVRSRRGPRPGWQAMNAWSRPRSSPGHTGRVAELPRESQHVAPAAGRRRGRDHPVQLPARPRDPLGRAGAGSRECRDPQAGPAHPGYRRRAVRPGLEEAAARRAVHVLPVAPTSGRR